MATHSSMLAWRIPWTEKPERLQHVGSQRVRHDWMTNTILYNNASKISSSLPVFLVVNSLCLKANIILLLLKWKSRHGKLIFEASNEHSFYILQLLFSVVSHVGLFVTPWTAACQAPLSFTISQSLLKLISIKLMTPSNHFILCCLLLLLPSIFPSIRVFSNEWVLHIRWPKYWNFSFIISPSNEYSMVHYNFTPQHINNSFTSHQLDRVQPLKSWYTRT